MGGVQIRVGVGGWTYEPWRETFYPEGLAQSRELEYMSRQLTAIEVNGTFYRTMTREAFERWRTETPEGFILSLKAPRYATNRRRLPEARPAIQRFFESGVSALGPRLGPLLWQLAPTKRFDAAELGDYLSLLPAECEGLRLRHVLEVRHESFMCDEYLALARRFNVATVFTDSPDYPSFADLTGDFVYARLMKSQSRLRTGYPKPALAAWAERAKQWAGGDDPHDLPHIASRQPARRRRDVFIFFINGAKERAPGGARALLASLGLAPDAGRAAQRSVNAANGSRVRRVL
jgi:uncharacterized protein YecE (DUF72 family)